MKMLLDIGNSRTKICFYNQSEFWNVTEVIETKDLETNLLLDKVNICLMSATGDETEWIELLEEKRIAYKKFNYKLNLPVKLSYSTPESLGNDRIAGVCGAKTLFPNKNILVIDAGTAITYDIVTEMGEHIGGNISPGLNMRYKSLNTFTKRLPLLNFRESVIEIGNSTEEAIHKGVQYGIIAEMFAYINEWKAKLKPLNVIITGGDASFFENSLKSNIFVVPNLVLFGLKSILEINE
jgi:type III pantothenate kinase